MKFCLLFIASGLVSILMSAAATEGEAGCEAVFPKSSLLKSESIGKICASSARQANCLSVEGAPIFHFDKAGSSADGARILVFGQIHGDEGDAGVLAALWAERLLEISPKNSWRIVAMLNPDGSRLGTRMNKNKVDLNRNFPTKDWDELALKEWEAKMEKNPRRFPGYAGGSEPETQCAIGQIESFNPSVIVSIHTPYGILDYDGPKKNRVGFAPLPWRSLGTFPGSLGRYMWTERGIPVLTIELKDDSLRRHEAALKRLQDQISYLAAEKKGSAE